MKHLKEWIKDSIRLSQQNNTNPSKEETTDKTIEVTMATTENPQNQ